MSGLVFHRGVTRRSETPFYRSRRSVRFPVEFVRPAHGLTPLAFGLLTASWADSAERLLDGHLSEFDLKLLLADTGAKPRHVLELVEARYWEPVADGHLIVGWRDFNPTRARVYAQRKRWRENARRRVHARRAA